MAIASFYCPSLALNQTSIELDPNEASHAVKSRRLRVGDQLRLFNGLGLSATASIESLERRSAHVSTNSFEQQSRPSPKISVVVAIPKGDRQKVLVDMLTQLGVFEIVPLRCDRSVTKFSTNTLDKWHRVAVEACKQSQNPWLPLLSQEMSLIDLLNDESRSCYYTDASGPELNNTLIQTSSSSPERRISLVIGPEGGFSPQEFTLLEQFMVPSFRVGPYILRTEAAAIAAASALVSS